MERHAGVLWEPSLQTLRSSVQWVNTHWPPANVRCSHQTDQQHALGSVSMTTLHKDEGESQKNHRKKDFSCFYHHWSTITLSPLTLLTTFDIVIVFFICDTKSWRLNRRRHPYINYKILPLLRNKVLTGSPGRPAGPGWPFCPCRQRRNNKLEFCTCRNQQKYKWHIFLKFW